MTTPHLDLRADGGSGAPQRREHRPADESTPVTKYFLGRPAGRWREALHGHGRPRHDVR
jgi:hypothetical protein